MLTLAISGVCGGIAAGAVSASAARVQPSASGPALVVQAGVRGLAVAAGPLVAGDTVERTATVVNQGTGTLSAVTATVRVTSPSALSGPGGLQMRIDSCPTAWKVAAGALSCSTKPHQFAGWGALTTSPVKLTTATGLKAGGAIRLRIALRLPSTAANSFAGLATGLSWTFSGA